MLDPAVCVRREVRVLGEDVLRRDVLIQLHEKTGVAHRHMEWIERLHAVQRRTVDIALAQRRHAKIDESVTKRRRAGSAWRTRVLACRGRLEMRRRGECR